MQEVKFFICQHCGNLIGMIHDAGVPMMCCGQKMTRLEAGAVEASQEKHIPVATLLGKTVSVTVGEVAHPMTAEHSIQWVYLLTDKGGQRKNLPVGAEPTVTFALTADEKPLAVYAYCNLHGLWMAEVEEPKVCDLPPVNTETKENYPVCRCNNVSYFDILDAVYANDKMDQLMDVFENVKNTTKCSTGCGGCYDKVINIISDVMASGER
jgi:superoxide reductase